MDTYTPRDYQHPAKIDARRLPAFVNRVPQPYEPDAFIELNKSLDKCLALDDAKWHMTWVEVAAAWAKMAKNKEIERKARRFRIDCWIQCGRILLDNKEPPRVDPKTGSAGKGKNSIQNPNARIAQAARIGMRPSDMSDAIALAKIQKKELSFFIEESRLPPTPGDLRRKTSHLIPNKGTGRPSASEMRTRLKTAGWANFMLLTRTFSAKQVAEGIAPGREREAVSEDVGVMLVWLEDLSARLSKRN